MSSSARPATVHPGTRWTAPADAAQLLAQTPERGRTPLVLLDPVLAGLRRPWLDALVRATRAADVVVAPASTAPGAVRELHERLRPGRFSSLIAVGGGTTIDLAVLASLHCAPQVLGCVRFRAGLVLLPPDSNAMLPRLAVPTTLGTGAEVSTAACLSGPRGKSLLLGAALAPEIAVIDPQASASLPTDLIAQAWVEVLARVLVPYTAPPVGHPEVVAVADTVALGSLRLLGGLRGILRSSDRPSASTSESDRLRLATISAHSHSGWGQLGRPFAASPLWFLATELSHRLGWSKARATAALLPGWARLIASGEPDLGDRERLRTAWTALTGSATDDVGGELGRLLEPLGGRYHLEPCDLDDVAAGVVRRWSAAGGAMARITADTWSAWLRSGCATRAAAS